MAALPSFRLQHHLPAFTHTGVNYFGPISVTVFRRKVKHWGCIFTCLSSRAVHFEMAYALDTDAFVNAMFRFENHRGRLATYHSDNGTNFVGAERELGDRIKRLGQSLPDWVTVESNEYSTHLPHHTSEEPGSRTAKVSLNVVLRDQPLTDETLSTALVHVENLLNGHPLTLVSVDPGEPEALTRNHLLLSRANPNLAPDLFNAKNLDPRKRWRFEQSIVDQFWRRWIREYVSRLMERGKWKKRANKS